MALDFEIALERALVAGGEWVARRALLLSGETPPPPPRPDGQAVDGSFPGRTGQPSPGATGLRLCRLALARLLRSEPAAAACRWLLAARTPAGAWLDDPRDVPGEVDGPAAGRVWATASAVCGLVACGRDPGAAAGRLLRGEVGQDGQLSGGVYSTLAGGGALWALQGEHGEEAQWALRWAREAAEDLDPVEAADGLTYWTAAGVPPDHPSFEAVLEHLVAASPPQGFADLELTATVLELVASAWR